MNKTTEALKLAGEALNYAIKSSGGETGCNHDYGICFCKEEKALAAIREALAEPVKQEPVALVDEIGNRLDGTYIFNAVGKVDVGQPLYAAPVSVEAAVLAEREECAKVCEDYSETLHQWNDKRKTFAAAIRARGEK